ERTALSIYRARNRAVLSPLRRMPLEILGKIFLLTLPKTENAAWTNIPSGIPWVFTHVSSYWRKLALSTP
ncbi:hypothetical protein C8R45DRAFT_779015, partial [Mycena sanguinolenta]